MNTSKNQFRTTARLKEDTRYKAEKAKLRFRFPTIESAIDTFILLGIKAYRESLKAQSTSLITK